jgi:hypothetical protein
MLFVFSHEPDTGQAPQRTLPGLPPRHLIFSVLRNILTRAVECELGNVSNLWRPNMIDKKIFITCPTTGVPVSTGFRAPPGTDITALKRVLLRRCQACSGEHVWNGEDGYWEENEPAPSLWEALRIRWHRLRRV